LRCNRVNDHGWVVWNAVNAKAGLKVN